VGDFSVIFPEFRGHVVPVVKVDGMAATSAADTAIHGIRRQHQDSTNFSITVGHILI